MCCCRYICGLPFERALKWHKIVASFGFFFLYVHGLTMLLKYWPTLPTLLMTVCGGVSSILSYRSLAKCYRWIFSSFHTPLVTRVQCSVICAQRFLEIAQTVLNFLCFVPTPPPRRFPRSMVWAIRTEPLRVWL